MRGPLGVQQTRSMPRHTSQWKPVQADEFESARSSGHTVRMGKNQYPDWAAKVPKIQAIWVHDYSDPQTISSTGTSTPVSGSFDVERRGKHPGEPLKVDRYYYISMEDGSYWQSGPYKDLDYGHHLDKRPGFLNQYPRSSSGADA